MPFLIRKYPKVKMQSEASTDAAVHMQYLASYNSIALSYTDSKVEVANRKIDLVRKEQFLV